MRRRTPAARRAGGAAISPVEEQTGGRGRLEAADALRALATVVVVVIHTTHWPYHSPVFNAIDRLSRMAVPAFMLLTGVLLAYQHGGSRIAPGVFLRRRFSRSLLPWFVWAPFYAATGWLFTGDVPHSWGDLGTFFSYGAGHLWYLLLIPQMYLIFLVWPRRRLWLWAAIAMAAQVGLSLFRLYGPMPASAVEQLTLWHGFQLLPFWVGYLAVGLAAGRSLAVHGPPARVRWPAIAAAAIATAGSGWLLFALDYQGAPHEIFQEGTGGFLLPQEPLFVLSTATLVLLSAPLVQGRRLWSSAIRVLSDNSLGVYILHPIIVYPIASLMYGALLAQSVPFALVGFVVLTVAALVLATLLSMLLSATPLAPTLGGRRRPLRVLRRASPTQRHPVADPIPRG